MTSRAIWITLFIILFGALLGWGGWLLIQANQPADQPTPCQPTPAVTNPATEIARVGGLAGGTPVYRVIDADAGVVCYVYVSYGIGGCLPINQTNLEKGQ